MTPVFAFLGCWALAKSANGTFLLGAEQDLFAKARSLSGTMEVTFATAKPQTWKFKLLKPNLYEIVGPDQEYRFNGKEETTYLPSTHEYTASSRTGASVTDAPFLGGLESFFGPTNGWRIGEVRKANFGAKPSIALVIESPGSVEPIELFVDPVTRQPQGWLQTVGGRKVRVAYTSLRFNPGLDSKDAYWSVPAAAKKAVSTDPAAKLLPVDGTAPGFTLYSVAGARIDLKEDLTKAKATILTFWHTNCMSCPEEFKHLQTLYSKLSTRGLQVIGINRGEKKEAVQKFAADSKTTFSLVVDNAGQKVAEQYGVSVYPTTYILDAAGKIVDRCIGFDPFTVEKALEKLGLRID